MTGTITRRVEKDADLHPLAEAVGVEVLEEIRMATDGVEPVDVTVTVDAEPADGDRDEPEGLSTPEVRL